eukprot:NODE_1948_length_1327_cov_19.635000_g1851_i0.p1 GENE.NODE_1948_length_1327_cov_19.635000_g1851_i0~~NODE_1948_length_1327_cov_19.635000_g1851_i0.p1  ORF type:complete len:382 (+),score=142.82 NODE_1948_length_1327_cov_19.635000_g1851_i0:62-1147(+)
MADFNAAAQHYNNLYADDELDSYLPFKRETVLGEQFQIAERKFEALMKDLHMPFLDVKLYRKYFIAQKSEQNLSNLLSIIETLSTHKAHTLRLLKLIFEREQIVNVIKVMAYDYAKGKLSTLEVQTKVLQLLYALQQVSLQVIEGIQEWRSLLTRPFAFEWRGINYIFKIIKDCQFIDTCDLNSVLPLQLGTYPLCSNLNSLNLFGPPVGATASAVAITYPMKMKKRSKMPPVTAEFQQRLQRAEVIIFSEHNLQLNLIKELSAINGAGAFLTILDVKHVVPNCCDGIRLNNKAWDKRLQTALEESFKKLQSKLAAPSPSPSLAEEQQSALSIDGPAAAPEEVTSVDPEDTVPTLAPADPS